MKLNTRISKLHNELFFISNLSEWSPFCRKAYNRRWLKKNLLTTKEVAVLRRLARVLRKNPTAPKFYAHFDENKTLRRLHILLGDKGFRILSETRRELASRFEVVWRQNKKHLLLVRKRLCALPATARPVIKVLTFLYEVKPRLKELEVFLLMSPTGEHVVSGGSSLERNKIEIECTASVRLRDEKHEIARVLLHEIIHALFESKVRARIEKFIKSKEFRKNHRSAISNLRAYSKENQNYGEVVKEMIAVSLLPEGYLAEKFFGVGTLASLARRKAITDGTLKKTYYDLMLFAVFALRDIAMEYAEQERHIDARFIRKAIEVWVEFERADLSRFRLRKNERVPFVGTRSSTQHFRNVRENDFSALA